MMRNWFRNPRDVILVPIVLTLALVIACGTAAPEQPAAEQPAAQPTAAQQEAPKDSVAAPTAVPKADAAPQDAVKPAGTLNSGLKELGLYFGHPLLSVNPSQAINLTPPLGEGPMLLDINAETKGWLLESWSISEDFTTWTLNLRQGVQFHKGYGEMTAEDVVWSYVEGWAQNSPHARYQSFQDFWVNPEGSVKTPDPYTIVVNTGSPTNVALMQDLWMVPTGAAHWVASKRQTDEIGVEEANRNPALTGPWEMVEHGTGQWRMEAVEDHWRQTPYFDELIFWEVPEESSRVAGFQTGRLDTFQMNFDSIPAVEAVPGAKIMSVPYGADYTLTFYGNHHVEALAGEPTAAYDPDLPWVSGNPDTDSDEWQRAVKVRQAMIMAIDREAILETILAGHGRLGILRAWALHEDRWGDRRWEYDQKRAKELLAEADYAEGFNITLTPAIRGAAAELEICEAVASMWGDIGIDVKFQRIPYGTLRPQVVANTYQGATCHPTSFRTVPGPAYSNYTQGFSSFDLGATHPFIEERYPRLVASTDDEGREKLEEELGHFMFDNALTGIALFVGEVVWPVGPRIEEWTQNVRIKQLRTINGYEYIQHRQK